MFAIDIAGAQADLPAGEEVGRRRIPLTDGWLIKQLDGDTWDAVVLARESASPDNTWLPARMPAQAHDVLLAHGRIADRHIGRNAADGAWVGDKNWAYVCRFLTAENIANGAFLRFEGLDTLADAAVRFRGPPCQRALACEHAAISKRGGALAQGI